VAMLAFRSSPQGGGRRMSAAWDEGVSISVSMLRTQCSLLGPIELLIPA
jgi:hypothetical protein